MSVYVFPGHVETLSSVTPDQQSISRKNKRKKTSDTSIIRKKPIQEPVKTRKRAKEITLTDVEKACHKETPQFFWRKVDYKGDTNEKTHGYDDSPSETDGCVRNLAKEHVYEENEEFKEDTSEINNTNESKIIKGKTEESLISSLLAKTFSLKLTQEFIFFVNTYEQDMIAVGKENKKY